MIVHKDALSDHQDEFLMLDEPRVLANLRQPDRCPVCYSEAFLWRTFDSRAKAMFAVRCANERCKHQVPQPEVYDARQAVAAWRLANKLSQ